MAPPASYGGGYMAPVGMAGRGPGGGRDYGTAASNPMAPAVNTPAPIPAAAPIQQSKGMPMAADNQELIVDPKNVKWNPSPEFFYPMAYNPVMSVMMYKFDKAGHTLPYLIKNPNVTNMIDYSRHNITTLFGSVPPHMAVAKDNSELTRNLVQAVQDSKEEEQSRDENGKRLEHTLALPTVIATTSLEAAIQDVRTEALAIVDKENPPMLFQAYALAYTPIIDEKSEYDVVARLADSSSYIELREKLNDISGKASPELVTELNLRMTALVNFILHKNLAISPDDLLVDDFAVDLDQLLSIFKEKYNQKMLDMFLKDQSLRIKSVLLFPDTSDDNGRKLHELLKSNLISESWAGRDDQPQFTFIGYTVRLSLINILSHDLQIAGMTKIPNLLTEQQTPALFRLAKSVFSSDNEGQLVARQLVVTKDARILELTEGLLVDGSYLVSLVK
jgi:hypothetical protein